MVKGCIRYCRSGTSELCNMHYMRNYLKGKTGSANSLIGNYKNKECSVELCDRRSYARGYCQKHYYLLYFRPKNIIKIRKQQKDCYYRNIEKSREKGRNNQEKRKGRLSYKFSEYKKSAKDHNREFLLTKDDFNDLWGKPCYYCNAEIETIGLDRINNEIGYTRINVVPCCIRCNKMKKNINYEDFIRLCKTISLKPIPFAR